ncbi:MAG TPA: YhgN family NAAT transporter [Blastocatellia bacterium]|nr:YhgN family NAAT transporter [Blastocatellia bacterium]
MEILTAATTLFLIMDPLGNVPVFISMLKNVAPERRRMVLIRELVIAYLVMLAFLVSGQHLLKFLSLKQESISIAGGIVLFLIALRMIFPQEGGIMGEQSDGEPFIVPLAIPMIAGPSTLAALLLMAQSAPKRMISWMMALTAAWLVTATILLASPLFFRLLRQRGLTAMERLMGMLLVMMSVQMFLNGLDDYLRK